MKTHTWLLVGTTCLTLAVGPAAHADEGDSDAGVHPIGLSLDLGLTTGVGGAVVLRPFDHLGVRGGIQYLELDSVGFEVDDEYGGTTANYEFGFRFLSAPITLDYYPWKESYFRISAGVLLNGNEFELSAMGNVEINGNTYPNERVDTLIDWDDVSAYLAIGGDIFCFDDAKRWSLGWELGVAYTGEPEVMMTNPTGNVTANDLATARRDVEDALDFYQVWIVAKLSLNFRF